MSTARAGSASRGPASAGPRARGAADTVGERVAAAIDDRTAAAIVSTVFFTDARIAGALAVAARACAHHGAELLLDAYHQLNVVPFSLAGVERAFVVGGGYKYCQLGEGNAFLRVPPGCRLRPVVTGWFAEFERLEEAPGGGVAYPEDPRRVSAAPPTIPPATTAAPCVSTSREQGLHPELLREVSQHQLAVLCRAFDALDLPRGRPPRRETPLERFAASGAALAAAGALCAPCARPACSPTRGARSCVGPALTSPTRSSRCDGALARQRRRLAVPRDLRTSKVQAQAE